MNEYLQQFKTQVTEIWQKMSKVQKIIIIGSTVLLLGTLIILTKGASAPDYGVLFTVKDNREAGQIIAKLKEKKVLYQVVDNGANGGVAIMVPSKDILETRLDLAAQAIPTGGVVGFESLDKMQVGETDTDRRARYLRALQGELTRTIEGMAEVESARVHVVVPEPSLFTDEQKNTTAAVVLKLKPYKNLEEGQVRGLVKLVSSSVEGLKPENVTIVDMAGNVLTEELSFDQETRDRRLTINQVELRQRLQKELQGSVQSMLEKIIGIGKAVVRVQLTLDFDKIQQKKQEFGDNVPRSSQKSEETSTSSDTADPSGAPGTDSNIPGYVSEAQNGTNESSKTEAIINYEIDSFEEVLEKAPGSIKRLSVAVVVGKELDSKVKKDIEEVVKAASGFQVDRGDQISVAGMPFNTEYQDRINQEIAEADRKQQLMILGALAALAALLIGGVVTNIIIKRRKAKELQRQLEAELAAAQEFQITPVPVSEIEELIQDVDITEPEESESDRIQGQLEKMAKENPGDMAQLLKTWLAEE